MIEKTPAYPNGRRGIARAEINEADTQAALTPTRPVEGSLAWDPRPSPDLDGGL